MCQHAFGFVTGYTVSFGQEWNVRGFSFKCSPDFEALSTGTTTETELSSSSETCAGGFSAASIEIGDFKVCLFS